MSGNRNFTILGIPNYSRDPTAYMFANSYEVIAASNLADEEPSNVSRLSSVDPISQWGLSTFANRDANSVVLVNSNISPWGMYRFTSYKGNIKDFVPTSVAASSNMSGAYTDVTDPISSSSFATYNGPTSNGTVWSARYAFGAILGTLPVGPASGPYMGAAVARVGYAGVPVTINGVPDYAYVACELWDSGTLVASLGTRAASLAASSGGQVLIWRFNPNLLARGAADTQIRLICTPDLSASQYIKVDSVHVYYENPADLVGQADSGWIQTPIASQVVDYNFPAPSVNLPYFFPAATQLGPLVMAWISDDQTTHDPNPPVSSPPQASIGPVAIPVGYLEAGVFCAGKAFTLAYGTTKEKPFQLRVVPTQRGGQTEGGQSYAADAYRQRAADFELKLSQAELTYLMNVLDFSRGYVGAVYIAADPDAPLASQVFNSGWITLNPAQGSSGTGDAAPLQTIYDPSAQIPVYVKQFHAIEKL